MNRYINLEANRRNRGDGKVDPRRISCPSFRHDALVWTEVHGGVKNKRIVHLTEELKCLSSVPERTGRGRGRNGVRVVVLARLIARLFLSPSRSEYRDSSEKKHKDREKERVKHREDSSERHKEKKREEKVRPFWGFFFLFPLHSQLVLQGQIKLMLHSGIVLLYYF